MKLSEPFKIGARLLPALQIGDAWISIQFAGGTSDGRTRYEYFIDTPVFEHSARDLKSGVGGDSLQAGMESLLSFLGAAADSFPDGENADLFPANVTEWAYQHSDEISMLQCELEAGELICD